MAEEFSFPTSYNGPLTLGIGNSSFGKLQDRHLFLLNIWKKLGTLILPDSMYPTSFAQSLLVFVSKYKGATRILLMDFLGICLRALFALDEPAYIQTAASPFFLAYT